MKTLTLKFSVLFVFFALNTSNRTCAQTGVNLNQDSRFEDLLSAKRKINITMTVNDRYKIQIFNGETDAAKTILLDFKKNYKNTDGIIVFNTPIYKVWVGNFKTRIEAEKNLLELKKKFPLAFIIKPNN